MSVSHFGEALFLGNFLLELEFDLTTSFFLITFGVGFCCVLRFGSDGIRLLPFKWQFSVKADSVDVTLVTVFAFCVVVFLIRVFNGLPWWLYAMGRARLARGNVFLIVNCDLAVPVTLFMELALRVGGKVDVLEA